MGWVQIEPSERVSDQEDALGVCKMAKARKKATLLNINDMKKNDQKTREKVLYVIQNTDSKREMAKALYYCEGWGEYQYSTMASNRLRELGFTVAHIEHYLPKTYYE